ncbi:hypothetical protein FSB08_25175 [Paraburkholderia sp. JPY432]|uniref:hypothetical protein n=1 Tax=Paraburkholderia youngii TaxID=2782701 RepID=UPI0015950C34|nr:hypothetical protein [Paraburkholderia youngii]NVH75743.1 hypothetical protein [Paraburkholderia youngii]
MSELGIEMEGQTMCAGAKKQVHSAASALVERLLASAAGAVMQTDGVEQFLSTPDAEVGRLLKQKVRTFRKHLLRLPSQKSPTQTNDRLVAAVELPLSKTALAEQSLIARRRLIYEGQLLEPLRFRNALQITRQAVSAATRANRLFTVDIDGKAYYPAFFVSGAVDRNVLEHISRALGQLPGWTKWDFFVSRRGSLGDSCPLEALAKGMVDLVENVARAYLDELTR